MSERPREGEVWADLDPRMTGRHVIVERVDDTYAYCTECASTGSRYQGYRRGGTRLLLRRMDGRKWRWVATPTAPTPDGPE